MDEHVVLKVETYETMKKKLERDQERIRILEHDHVIIVKDYFGIKNIIYEPEKEELAEALKDIYKEFDKAIKEKQEYIKSLKDNIKKIENRNRTFKGWLSNKGK